MGRIARSTVAMRTREHEEKDEFKDLYSGVQRNKMQCASHAHREPSTADSRSYCKRGNHITGSRAPVRIVQPTTGEHVRLLRARLRQREADAINAQRRADQRVRRPTLDTTSPRSGVRRTPIQTVDDSLPSTHGMKLIRCDWAQLDPATAG